MMGKLINVYDKIYPKQIAVEYPMDRVYWVGSNGKQYLDLLGGSGCFFLWNFSDGMVNKILSSSVRRFISTSNFMIHEDKINLMKQLRKLTGYDIVFFLCSGSESNDAAMKLAWKYSFNRRKVNGGRIVCFDGAYHGMTLGAVRCGDRRLSDYLPFNDLYLSIPFNTKINFRPDNIAGVIIESGLNANYHGYWEEEILSYNLNFCKENDIPIIADEVRIGLGKSGRLFASDYWCVKPDIVTIGKSLSAGMPLTAVLADSKFSEYADGTWHSSTAGGNPNLCRLASYLIEPLFDKNTYSKVVAESMEMDSMLSDVFDGGRIRFGKFWYLIPDNPPKVAEKLKKNKVLVYCRSGDRIVLHPSLFLNIEDWKVFLDALRKSI